MYKYQPEFLKNDPGMMLLFMVFKVLMVMCSYLLIGYFFLNLKQNILIWGCFYIAFAAISCARGNITQRKKIFLYFSITVILSLWLAGVIYPYKLISIILIVVYCTGAFWIRKFGDEFIYFPVYSALIFMVSAIQLPIPPKDFSYISEALILAALLFYIGVLLWWPWDTPKQLKKLISNYIYQLYTYSKQHFINYSVLTIDPINNLSHKINQINDKGESWISNQNTKKHWHHVCSELNILSSSINSLTKNLQKIPGCKYKKDINLALKYILLAIKYLIVTQSKKKSIYYTNKASILIEDMQKLLLIKNENNQIIQETAALHEIIFTMKRIIFVTKLVQYHVKKL